MVVKMFTDFKKWQSMDVPKSYWSSKRSTALPRRDKMEDICKMHQQELIKSSSLRLHALNEKCRYSCITALYDKKGDFVSWKKLLIKKILNIWRDKRGNTRLTKTLTEKQRENKNILRTILKYKPSFHSLYALNVKIIIFIAKIWICRTCFDRGWKVRQWNSKAYCEIQKMHSIN